MWGRLTRCRNSGCRNNDLYPFNLTVIIHRNFLAYVGSGRVGSGRVKMSFNFSGSGWVGSEIQRVGSGRVKENGPMDNSDTRTAASTSLNHVHRSTTPPIHCPLGYIQYSRRPIRLRSDQPTLRRISSENRPIEYNKAKHKIWYANENKAVNMTFT
jgi:hypothetical protein